MALIIPIPWNVRVGGGLKNDLMQVSHFTDGTNKAQRGEVTCPRSYSKLKATVTLVNTFIEIDVVEIRGEGH